MQVRRRLRNIEIFTVELVLNDERGDWALISNVVCYLMHSKEIYCSSRNQVNIIGWRERKESHSVKSVASNTKNYGLNSSIHKLIRQEWDLVSFKLLECFDERVD